MEHRVHRLSRPLFFSLASSLHRCRPHMISRHQDAHLRQLSMRPARRPGPIPLKMVTFHLLSLDYLFTFFTVPTVQHFLPSSSPVRHCNHDSIIIGFLIACASMRKVLPISFSPRFQYLTLASLLYTGNVSL